MKEIGLEFLMKLHNINSSDIAKELGLTRKSINNWFKCRSKIPKKHLGKLSSLFDVKEHCLQKELNVKEKIELSIKSLKKIFLLKSRINISER